MNKRTEEATIVLDTLRKNPLLSADHRKALAIGISAIKLLDLEQTGWIPLTKRPITEEERECYRGCSDDVIFECEMPEDNQEVIVSYGDNVRTDIFCIEDGGYHFDCVDIKKVTAWMPLPQPYKAESEDAE